MLYLLFAEKTTAEIDQLIAAKRAALVIKRDAMKVTLMNGKTAFGQQVEQINNQFLANFEQALVSRGLTAGTTEYDDAVNAYKAVLAGLKDAALLSYDARVNEIIAKIQMFHEKLLLK